MSQPTARPSFGYCVEAPIAWRDLLALARELDEHSLFDTLWMPDALTAHGAAKLEPFTVLAAIAQATRRLRLGTLVVGNAFRNPALLAQAAATLDHISGGRLTLGLGAGWPGENRRYGIDFWARAERIARLDEAIQVLKLLWTESAPRFAGRFYRLDAPPYRVETLQQPHPPLLLGGGEGDIVKVMARHAAIVSPMTTLQWTLRDAREQVADQCRQFGRSPEEIRWAAGGSLFLHEDKRAEEAAIKFACDHYGRSEQELRVNGLFGSADALQQRVRELVTTGATEIFVFQLPRVHMTSLMRFSADVIAPLRKQS